MFQNSGAPIALLYLLFPVLILLIYLTPLPPSWNTRNFKIEILKSDSVNFSFYRLCNITNATKDRHIRASALKSRTAHLCKTACTRHQRNAGTEF